MDKSIKGDCMADNNKNISNKSVNMIFGAIIILILWGIGSCSTSRIDHDDGKCDICSKKATYQGSEEEYCKEHLQDAIEWYIEQSQK